MMKRVFLIHGWDGRPDNHWFPWLTLELKARGFKVYAPAMPRAANPKVKEWVDMLRQWVGKPDKDTYFVGHSLGCVAITRYLEALPEKAKIGGAVFVAGFSGNVDIPEIAEFNSDVLDLKKVKAHGNNFLAIFSNNDDTVPLPKGLAFAQSIGAKVIIEKGKGHFCAGDGVTSLPSVLSALVSFSTLNPNR